MSFPLWYLLIPYALFLAVTVVFLFINIFHIARFGLQALKTTLVLGLYIISFLSVLAFTSLMLADFDWSAQIELEDIISPSETVVTS